MFFSLFTSCKDEEKMIFHPGQHYLPLQTETFQVYAVSETRYSSSADPVELSYEIMTQLVDSFPSAKGEYIYVIHRNKRLSAGAPWEPLDTWSIRPAKGDIVVSEGNIPFVKIKSPVAAGNVWDGNILNTGEADMYQYTGIGLPLELNAMFFENTLTVEQENNDDKIVFLDQRKEIYALDIGLVYKEFIQLNYCTDDGCLGQQKVNHGVKMIMVIKDYGKL